MPPESLLLIRPEASQPMLRKLRRHADRAASGVRILLTIHGECFDDVGRKELYRIFQTLARLRDNASPE